MQQLFTVRQSTSRFLDFAKSLNKRDANHTPATVMNIAAHPACVVCRCLFTAHDRVCCCARGAVDLQGPVREEAALPAAPLGHRYVEYCKSAQL